MNFRARPWRWPLLAALLLFAAGCAVLAGRELDTKYGTTAAKEFTPERSAPVSYERDIRPLMENRCLVCHGCYDAPCQLNYDLSRSGLSASSVAALTELHSLRGVAASIVPQVTLIHLKGHGLLTLLSNSAYTNIASMFGEADRRLVAEDSVTLANGVIGAYPNVFLDVSEADLPELVTRIRQLRTEANYSALLDRFGVRRTDSRFWSLSDQMLSAYRHAEPLTAGVLDYSRYDNR